MYNAYTQFLLLKYRGAEAEPLACFLKSEEMCKRPCKISKFGKALKPPIPCRPQQFKGGVMGKNWAALANKLYNVDLNDVSREEVWKLLKQEANVQHEKAVLKAANEKLEGTRILLTKEIGNKTSGSLDDTKSDELKSQIYPGITFEMTMKSY